jgi:hypothetical protein
MGDMPHARKRIDFRYRAAQVREIAEGIFDKTERRVVLQFVADAERLVQAAPPNAIITALDHSEPGAGSA